MTGFSAEWLALRAPADDAARDPALIDALCRWANRQGPLRIADYGGGTGAALSALAGCLPGPQAWWIVDNDPALLARIPPLGTVRTVCADLAETPGAGVKALGADGPALVTGFAFFDLVSAAWLDRLVPLIAARGAAVYAPLTYDGTERWQPEPPHEPAALAAFNADMGRDKGFGPALGGEAAPYLANALEAFGYSVSLAASPWCLSRDTDAPLMDALADGAAGAVGHAMKADEWRSWHEGRRKAASARIGHWDLLALPPS